MLFNSPEYGLFLVVVLAAYYVLALPAQNVLLLIASYVFYGFWDYRFCALLAASTLVDYFCGRIIERSEQPALRRRTLSVSLAFNLGMLGFFKYFNFFIDSAATALRGVGVDPHLPTLSIILPAGISFYTFQTLSYTLDVYRGHARAERNFITFALYVAYFPQLMAGPIERPARLLPRLAAKRRVTPEHISEGVTLILSGLVKKVAIADFVAGQVGVAFDQTREQSATTLVIGVYLFALQIYGDFSGYSDIARGSSRLLGVELMPNFAQPYLAASFREFWRRWHISLSQWLRDYVYVSLGGNRGSVWRTMRNLMITMLLGGLWHGANWTFVAWGFLHGLFLVLERVLTGMGAGLSNVPLVIRRLGRAVAWLAVLHCVLLAWVLFRAASINDAWIYLTRIFSADWVVELPALRALGVAGALMLAMDVPQYLSRDQLVLARGRPALRACVLGTMLIAIICTWSADYVPFIYFQF